MLNDNHRKSMLLVWGVFFLFAISTFTKVNFSAAIAYFVKEGIFTKTNSGTIVAAFYLIYSIGQIVGARFMNKFSPYKLVLTGLWLSICANIALCFSRNFTFVLCLWSANGLANCVMWPASVRVASDYVDAVDKRTATKMLTLSVAIGGISSYICTSPVLECFGWAGMFVLNTAVIFAMLIFWIFVNIKTDKRLDTLGEVIIEKNVSSEKDTGIGKVIVQSGISFVLLIVTIRAMLDNGLKTWIPTMMMESYSVSTTWAGLQTAIIYLCNIAGVFILTPVISRVKNEVKRYIFMFMAVMPFIVLLVWIGKIPIALVIVSFIIVSTLSYFMNDMSVTIPARFTDKGLNCSGSIASLLNGFGSVGVLAASVCFGYVAENFSWQTVIFCCIGLAALAIILAIAASWFWERFMKNE